MTKKTVEIEVENVVKETEKALLCEIHGEEIWLPKSQIDFDASEIEDGHAEGGSGTVTITEWIAQERGLLP